MTALDWAPTPKEVGAHVRARTKDVHGNELGTFTDETRPTVAQVDDLITGAQTRITNRLGPSLDAAFYDRARALAALGAAMMVELTHFPEMVATGRSPYPELKKLYDEDLLALVGAVSSGDGGTDSSGSLTPSVNHGTGLRAPPVVSPFAIPYLGDSTVPSVEWGTKW